MAVSPEIEALVAHLMRLPGLGSRSARRIAMSLLQKRETRLIPLIGALQNVADKVQKCSSCGNLECQNPCSICEDKTRKHDVLCVVEHVGDLWALERAGAHQGRYHILGGILSPLAGIGPEDLNLKPLFSALEKNKIKEVILALGTTAERAETAYWLQGKLAAFPVKVTRLGYGMPMGGNLEFLDDGTLTAAFMTRQTLE